jgi:hypothetical protein
MTMMMMQGHGDDDDNNHATIAADVEDNKHWHHQA